jgi:hypothetical protein
VQHLPNRTSAKRGTCQTRHPPRAALAKQDIRQAQHLPNRTSAKRSTCQTGHPPSAALAKQDTRKAQHLPNQYLNFLGRAGADPSGMAVLV